MAETVDLPAFGNVKKEYLIAGGALVLGIVGYAYYKRGRTPSDSSTDAVSASPDAFQGAALPAGSYDAYGNLVGTSQGTVTQPDSWVAQATNYLVSGFGYDRQTVLSAMAKYVNGEMLSKAEAQLVNNARALIGNSPDNLAVRIDPNVTTPTTPTTPTDTTPDYSNPAVYWDAWQAIQKQTGAYRADPGGGLDWGELARNTFGQAAQPTKQEVMMRAQQLQSINHDAASRYMVFVPHDVIPSLRLA